MNRRRWFTVMCEDGAVADWQLTVVLCVESGLLGACRFFALARLGVRLGGAVVHRGDPRRAHLFLLEIPTNNTMKCQMLCHGMELEKSKYLSKTINVL